MSTENNNELERIVFQEFEREYEKLEFAYRELPDGLQTGILSEINQKQLLAGIKELSNKVEEIKYQELRKNGFVKLTLDNYNSVGIKAEEKEELESALNSLQVTAALFRFNIEIVRSSPRSIGIIFKKDGIDHIKLHFVLSQDGILRFIRIIFRIRVLNYKNKPVAKYQQFNGGDHIQTIEVVQALLYYQINNSEMCFNDGDENEFVIKVENSLNERTELIL